LVEVVPFPESEEPFDAMMWVMSEGKDCIGFDIDLEDVKGVLVEDVTKSVMDALYAASLKESKI